MIKRPLVFETCCGSADDVIHSEMAGADRAELNSALALGGLTPSCGALATALEQTSRIKIITMVRPRSGGFCYTDMEYQTMCRDAKELLSAGSAGIVFGFLHEDGTINIERCKRFMDLIGDKDAVFHRAIDVVPDWKEAMDQLKALGVKRILTSGQRKSAYDGRETIRQMIAYAGDAIEILPGAGIRGNNVREIIDCTGCRQLHMSARRHFLDLSVSNNPEIAFGNPAVPEDSSYDIVDEEVLGEIIQRLRREYDNE